LIETDCLKNFNINGFYIINVAGYVTKNMIFVEAFGTTWTKQYCTYQKDRKEFTMIPYNQLTGKFVSKNEKLIINNVCH